MNLGNKYNIANFITFFKKLCCYNDLMLYLLIKLRTSVIFLLSKFLHSNQYEHCFWPETKKIDDVIESRTIKVKSIRYSEFSRHTTL